MQPTLQTRDAFMIRMGFDLIGWGGGAARGIAACVSRAAHILYAALWVISGGTAYAAGSAAAAELESAPAITRASLTQPVGTSISLPVATQVLLNNFNQLCEQPGGAQPAPQPVRKGIGLLDLRRIRETPALSADVRNAATFFLMSPLGKRLAGSQEARNFDFSISARSLEEAVALEAGGHLREAVLQLSAAFPDKKNFYSLLLRDSGIPIDVRHNIINALGDDQLTEILGRPISVDGGARDIPVETAALLRLVRVSWLGAVEATVLIQLKVPFAIDRGPADRGTLSWNGQSLHISEIMLARGEAADFVERSAREGGRAVFDRSGLRMRVLADIQQAGLTAPVVDLLSETFAGAFANRARLAMSGPTDAVVDRHLVMANDLNDRVYAAAAQAQLPYIQQIMSKDLVPYLQVWFGLLGDPDLARSLPEHAHELTGARASQGAAAGGQPWCQPPGLADLRAFMERLKQRISP
jgi:hypothetical protein